MSAPTPLELMQYVDGELAPRDARRVAEWLEVSEAGQRSTEGLEQLGDVVRAHLGAATPGIDVTAGVMAALATEHPDPRASSSRASAGAASGRDGSTATLRVARSSPRGRRLGAVWPIAAAGLAAAAAVALLVTRHAERPVADVSPRALGSERGAQASASAPSINGGGESEVLAGASVESLDPGQSGATLFVVQEGATSTPVVWLMDDTDESGDRIGPL